MKQVVMLTIDVSSEDELVRAIDKVADVPGVSEWTSDVLSDRVYRRLCDLGHVITRQRRARSWSAVAKEITT